MSKELVTITRKRIYPPPELISWSYDIYERVYKRNDPFQKFEPCWKKQKE